MCIRDSSAPDGLHLGPLWPAGQGGEWEAQARGGSFLGSGRGWPGPTSQWPPSGVCARQHRGGLRTAPGGASAVSPRHPATCPVPTAPHSGPPVAVGPRGSPCSCTRRQRLYGPPPGLPPLPCLSIIVGPACSLALRGSHHQSLGTRISSHRRPCESRLGAEPRLGSRQNWFKSQPCLFGAGTSPGTVAQRPLFIPP